MLPELRRYTQHISLSPDSINNDDVGSFVYLSALQRRSTCPPESVCAMFLQAVSPLMKYLQDTMVILTENLVKENLTR